MPRLDPAGAICRTSEFGCEDHDGPQFIYCVEGRHPKLHEFSIFKEDSVTLEGHPTARIDVGPFIGEYVATNYLTPTWRRVPMFVWKYINGSVE